MPGGGLFMGNLDGCGVSVLQLWTRLSSGFRDWPLHDIGVTNIVWCIASRPSRGRGAASSWEIWTGAGSRCCSSGSELWPLHSIAIANLVWCKACKWGVGGTSWCRGNVVYCAIIVHSGGLILMGNLEGRGVSVLQLWGKGSSGYNPNPGLGANLPPWAPRVNPNRVKGYPLTRDWPVHDLVVTNNVWCMAYKWEVEGGLYTARCAIVVQCNAYWCNSVSNAGGRGRNERRFDSCTNDSKWKDIL